MTKSRPTRWFCPPAAPSSGSGACCGRIHINTHFWLCSTSCYIMEKLTNIAQNLRVKGLTQNNAWASDKSSKPDPAKASPTWSPRATRPCPPSQTSPSSSLRPQPGRPVIFLLPERRQHPRGDTSQVWTCQSLGAEQHGRHGPPPDPPYDTAGAGHGVVADNSMHRDDEYGDYDQYGEEAYGSFDGSRMEGMAGSARAAGNKGKRKF